MPLKIVATPIGDPGDITLRAIEALKEAEIVVGEERKEASKLLKALGIQGKQLELLNEHSDEASVKELVEFCREKNVVLVSDCGTPVFCDPGARLIAACRAQQIPVSTLPGASSLMALLSLASQQVPQFVFQGFLPAETEMRRQALQSLKREQRAVILMDTPYRLEKLMKELAENFGERKALLGLDLTQPTEQVLEGTLRNLSEKVQGRKAEFVLLMYSELVQTARVRR